MTKEMFTTFYVREKAGHEMCMPEDPNWWEEWSSGANCSSVVLIRRWKNQRFNNTFYNVFL